MLNFFKIKNLKLEIIHMLIFIVFFVLFNSLYHQHISLLTPTLLIIMIGIYSVCKIYSYEQRLPIFDIGIILILVTVLYASYPFIAFSFSNFSWSPISDHRLYQLHPQSIDLAKFAWLYLAYIYSMAISYLLLRDKNRSFRKNEKAPDDSKEQIYFKLSIIIYISLILRYFFIHSFFKTFYIFAQISHVLAGIQFVLSIYIIGYCIKKWDKNQFKILALAFLLSDFLFMYFGHTGRTSFFLHLISFILFYSRYVGTISIKTVLFTFPAMLALFLYYGFKKVHILHSIKKYPFWSAANEFTSILGTTYDLDQRIIPLKQNASIPPQIYLSDILLLIPSQLLPLNKLDPSAWYLGLLNIHGKGVGMMFGVGSQAVIGQGNLEMILRGSIVGIVFAFLHNKCVNKQNLLWVNVLYVYIAIKSYYTFRASSGYILYFLIYYFFTAYFMIRIMEFLIQYVNKNKRYYA